MTLSSACIQTVLAFSYFCWLGESTLIREASLAWVHRRSLEPLVGAKTVCHHRAWGSRPAIVNLVNRDGYEACLYHVGWGLVPSSLSMILPPKSDSIWVANGPASTRVRSTTLMPARGRSLDVKEDRARRAMCFLTLSRRAARLRQSMTRRWGSGRDRLIKTDIDSKATDKYRQYRVAANACAYLADYKSYATFGVC